MTGPLEQPRADLMFPLLDVLAERLSRGELTLRRQRLRAFAAAHVDGAVAALDGEEVVRPDFPCVAD